MRSAKQDTIRWFAEEWIKCNNRLHECNERKAERIAYAQLLLGGAAVLVAAAVMIGIFQCVVHCVECRVQLTHLIAISKRPTTMGCGLNEAETLRLGMKRHRRSLRCHCHLCVSLSCCA